MKSMSKHHIVIPPPKVGLPERFQTDENIRDYMHNHPVIRVAPLSHGAVAAYMCDLQDMSRWWRIERSRADHLEEIVEGLQREVDDLRGMNGIFRRLFPRRYKNG